MIIPKEFGFDEGGNSTENCQDKEQDAIFFEEAKQKMRNGYAKFPQLREVVMGNMFEMLERKAFDRQYF